MDPATSKRRFSPFGLAFGPAFELASELASEPVSAWQIEPASLFAWETGPGQRKASNQGRKHPKQTRSTKVS